MKSSVKCMFALGLLVSSASYAADNGIYIGAALGRSNVKASESAGSFGSIGFDGNDTAYKVIVGIRPLDALAFEVSYVNFGKPDDHAVKVDADGVSGFVVGFLPVGPVDLFAKAGAINWNAKVSSHGVKLGDDDGTDFAYGAGAQFRIWSLSLRAEYERFEVQDHSSMASLGVTWTFL